MIPNGCLLATTLEHITSVSMVFRGIFIHVCGTSCACVLLSMQTGREIMELRAVDGDPPLNREIRYSIVYGLTSLFTSQSCKHSIINAFFSVASSVAMVTAGFYRAMLRRARYCYDKLSVRLSVCLSVTLRYCDYIGWKSSKIISWLVSLGCSLFATPTSRGYSKGNTPKFLPE